MTDEQINAAIHASLGNPKSCRTPKSCQACCCDECLYNKGLDYCTDLNAMHEAEKVLCRHMHESDSDRIVGDRMHAYAELIGYAIDATARQRAEAFLLTLGKWSATDKESLTIGATDKKSLEVQSTSSGESGGASTYGGKGLGIAGAAWPPETRITVNGKTFCLADIDKEMTE